MTRHFVEAVIKKGWQPYIESHWMDLNTQRGGAIITFKGHESHIYKCSNNVASEIIALYNEGNK